MENIRINFVDGFEHVWLLWAASATVLLLTTVAMARRLKWEHIRQLVKDEDGAAYTLSYVLAMPVYVLFICLVVETTFMLVAKIGTVYAAFAAARTGAVWYSADDDSDARQRSQFAAVRAFVPFSSGLAGLEEVDQAGQASNVDDYVSAYQEHVVEAGFEPASEKYLRGKYVYAERALDVTVTRQPGPSGNVWDENIVATVSYDYPYSVPGIGRILGDPDPEGEGGFITQIVSSVVLQIEHPWNDAKRLGIGYASPP